MSSERQAMEQLRREIISLAPLSFRKIDDARKLAIHFQEILEHPATLCTPKIHNYLSALDEQHKRAYTQKRECTEVDYIFASETKNNQQRQRFNSLSVAEVSELLKMEFASSEKSQKVHICLECNTEIETNDEEPLMESLQRHFNLVVHQPKKVESVDVSEPIVLPNLSRRKSAMVERGEAIAPPTTIEHLEQIFKEAVSIKPERPDRLFSAKLETFLVRNLPDNSEASINAAVKLHQSIYDQLCKDISTVDFSTLTGSVAPIIMSIKDNVNQHFAVESKASEEETEQKKTPKSQTKKFRYYGAIETAICKLLANHKLLTLVDDRTGKPAFFCMACEYYTLRFRYDSVLNHVFNETHIHNLSATLEADECIPFALKEKSTKSIADLNNAFLLTQGIAENNEGISCVICQTVFEFPEQTVVHILEDGHMACLSDELFRKYRTLHSEKSVPEEWGQGSIDWAKHLSGTGKVNTARDTVMVENFIKPSGKVANYCTSCDMMQKGPRQVLFNHVRQKKHIRNVAPQKLQYLFKNHCRPVEYYASFGNFYTCAICTEAAALPSFFSVVEHIESDRHIESIALLLKLALHYNETDFNSMLAANNISKENSFRCNICDVTFTTSKEIVTHILSNLEHESKTVENRMKMNKGDLISAYMKGNYILISEGPTFSCIVCSGTFASVRSLLMHLVYAEHFEQRPTSENVFRFYLELKHNIGLIARNKYSYSAFGSLYCGACCSPLQENENAKRHVTSLRHRESMGAHADNSVE